MRSLFPLCLTGALLWGSSLPAQTQGIRPLFPEPSQTPLPPSPDIPTLPIVPDPRPVPATPAPQRPLPRGSFEEISRYFRDLNRAKKPGPPSCRDRQWGPAALSRRSFHARGSH